MAPEHVDVAIVGGGPAGLAAAIALGESGVERIAVLEREPRVGGIARHSLHRTYGWNEFHRPLTGPAYVARMAAEAERAGAMLRPHSTVLRIEHGPQLALSTPEGLTSLTARRVLITTGVRESPRAARFASGGRPRGIFSTGQLQTLVALAGQRPFRRPLIVGSELVAFSALLTCRHAGIKPVGIVEAGSRIAAHKAVAWLGVAMGVPILTGTRLVRILGERQVEGVTVETLEGTRTIAADGVIFTGRWVPEATLAMASDLQIDPLTRGPIVDDVGRTSERAVFAAGNVLRGVETAHWSFVEGRTAGRTIAAEIAGPPPAAPTAPVVVRSEAIGYALPQRLRLEGEGVPTLQLRLARPARGTLIAEQWGRRLASRTIDAEPHQRLLLRFDRRPHNAADIELFLDERR